MSSLESLLSRIFFPFNDKEIEKYTYRVKNNSIILPFINKLFVLPLLLVLPKSLKPALMPMITFILSAIAFYVAESYKGRYPQVTLPLIGASIFLYMIVDSLTRPFAIKRGDRSHLTDFLQHYFHGFSLGFFSLVAISLFTSNEIFFGPFILVSVYLAAFVVLQEFTFHRTEIYIERFGHLEGLFILFVLCFLCIPRDIYWTLILPVKFGFSYLDFLMMLVTVVALATALAGVLRSKLYFSPATLLYIASCLLFIVLFFQMHNTMMAMVLFVLYSSELFGRMILARMISTKEAPPRIIPLIVVLLLVQVEQYIFGRDVSAYSITGYLFALFLMTQHLLLSYYAFQKLHNQHQAF